MWALIGEGALREPVGGAAVLRAQLAHLLELAALRHLTLQVVRVGVGAHVGLDGGFTLLEVGDEGLAFVEAQLTGRLVRDEGEVKTLWVWYDRIRAKALPEDDSVSLITNIMESL
ncbi:Scr1 family TA system antitoxin-like transcriptional regulator [Actinoallomurus sp. CA-150999]|uniref:Scr1 family TA system antitoxin-like transcriptional regulator n=1 Tax=Actinoallomurus sp. CA-150999 TaxID=3239887 RepID=UPI003D93970F